METYVRGKPLNVPRGPWSYSNSEIVIAEGSWRGIANNEGDYSIVSSVRRRRPKPSRWKADNPFYTLRRYGHGSWVIAKIPTGPYSYWQFEGPLGLLCVPNNEDLPAAGSLEASCLRDLYSKATEPVVPGVTWLGEALETVEGLRHPLNSLLSLSDRFVGKAVRRTRRLKGKEIKEALVGTWLEYQLAISPTVGAVADQVTALIDLFDPNRIPLRKVTTGKKRVISSSKQTYTGWLLSTYPVKAECTINRTVRAKGGMLLEVVKPTLSAEVGLDSLPAITAQAYELLPLSFAFDWCVNLGALIRSCRPLPGGLLTSYSTVERWQEIYVDRLYVDGKLVEVDAAQLYNVSRARRINPGNPGILTLGAGITSLTQGITAAALAGGLIENTWRRLPWR